MKKNLSALLIGLVSLSAVAKTIETKQIQVLLNPNASWNIYAANIGTEITSDPSVALPAGATSIQNGLIFPKDTVNLNQTSYLVSRTGMPLTTLNSIGMLNTTNSALVAYNPMNPPALGTIFQLSENVFSFYNNCSTSGQIFATGTTELVNNMAPGAINTISNMAVIGGTGHNESANGVVAIQRHLAPDGMSSILTVKFDKKIKINV